MLGMQFPYFLEHLLFHWVSPQPPLRRIDRVDRDVNMMNLHRQGIIFQQELFEHDLFLDC